MADKMSRNDLPPGTKLRFGVIRTDGGPLGAGQFGSGPQEPDQWHEATLGGNGFRQEENLWFIAFGQKTIRLPLAKGLAYIRYLLERPNEPIPVDQLVEAAHAGDREVARATDAEKGKSAASEPGTNKRTLGDAGPASDRRALAQLNDRLNELNDEISEAESSPNSDAVERLRGEKEQIFARIRADFDKRGRPRAERSTRNRQRNAVRKCIKDAIEEIRAVHSDLAAHLDLAIRYGYVCTYGPKEDPGWRFDW